MGLENNTLNNFFAGKPPFVPEKTGYVMTKEDEKKIEEDLSTYKDLFENL